MKVYILKNKYDEFASNNCAIAYDGFRQMGWEIVPFKQSDNPLLADLTSEDMVIRWRSLSIGESAPTDYFRQIMRGY